MSINLSFCILNMTSTNRKSITSLLKKEKKRGPDKNDAEGDVEHELSYYINDRVKLMKEVLKIIKPSKIKAMTPDCLKKFKEEEINSLLLDELLGISNKRLKYIFSGQNLDEDSSSTGIEEAKAIDVISLDDISDEDFIIEVDTNNSAKKSKIKSEPTNKKCKKIRLEMPNRIRSRGTEIERAEKENLMSVLELLELQARARAIRSQLALDDIREKKREKTEHTSESHDVVKQESDTDDIVIIEDSKSNEIVITSSDSENEYTNVNKSECTNTADKRNKPSNKKNEVSISEMSKDISDLDLPSEGNRQGINSDLDKNECEIFKDVPKQILKNNYNSATEEVIILDTNDNKKVEREVNNTVEQGRQNNSAEADEILINVDQSEMEDIHNCV